MKKLLFVLVAFVLFSSHDMYLKLDTYFLQPNASATIKLFNGTFDRSDNVIARNRMIDVSLVGNGSRSHPDTTQWSEKGQYDDTKFKDGGSGHMGCRRSTRARNIEMAAADFNSYLEHDGVLDMLEWRKNNDALEQDAVEKYSKHVKTIFQVGDKKTDDWQTTLGYPIEFIPLSNPYDLHPGHDLQVELLWQGEPLANQLVYVGSDSGADGHSHDHAHDHEHTSGTEEDHHHHHATQLRTDANGHLTVKLTTEGIWYLRTIYLAHSEEAGLTHESNWATLTFELGHGHSHSHDGGDHHHHHAHESSFGIPAYVYWIGSFVLVAGLFFWFNRKS